MKGDAQPLIKFFDGSDKRFIIPLYQRNYDWKEENCEQLFQDLMKLHNSNRRSHFFGSIVSSIQSGTEDRFIIDGQQRITTVSLLLIAMVNAKKEGLIEATDAKLVEKIFKRYLVDEYQEDERKVKLKPIKKDMQAFDALLYKQKDQYIKESNVTRNYDFFYNLETAKHTVHCHTQCMVMLDIFVVPFQYCFTCFHIPEHTLSAFRSCSLQPCHEYRSMSFQNYP